MNDTGTVLPEPRTRREPVARPARRPRSTSRASRSGVVVAVARWSATHRAVVLIGWVVFVIACTVIGGAVGTEQLSDADSGSGASAAADRELADADFGTRPVENLLITSRTGKLDDADATAAVTDARAALGALPAVASVGEVAEAADGSALLVPVELAVASGGADTEDAAAELLPAVLAATAKVQQAHPDLRVEVAGETSIDVGIDDVVAADFRRAELTSLPVTLVILLVAFGALVAAGVPVLLGMSAVLAALGLSALVSQVLPVSSETSSVVLLIGLAVGVDYSLFAIRRAREEREAGASTLDAIAIAAATSGRAVVVSGVAVAVAMSGMYLAGNAIFSSFATGTILVVAVAVLASMTALPALLATLGDRIDRGGVPLLTRWLRRRRTVAAGRGTVVSRLVDAVLRWPAVSMALAVVGLTALALPALGLRAALPGDDDLPRSIPAVAAYERMTAAFPQTGAVDTVVFWSSTQLPAPALRAAVVELAANAPAAVGLALGDADLVLSRDARVAYVDLPITVPAASQAAGESVEALRGGLVSAALGDLDVHWGVTGDAAGTRDFDAAITARLPWVVGLVLSVTFVVLLLAFGSLVLAATAIALNLLSVAAAYGLLVLVFQHHWAEGLLGFRSDGAVVSWLPLFLFVVLFGLSMDYHVFVVSRIREGVRRGLSTREAVRAGITATAGTVTSAAVIMVAVFSIFATLTLLEFKQLGVGLAAAILLDATIVRLVLLPATMVVLGRWNWWSPQILRKSHLAEHEDQRHAEELQR